MDDLERDGRIKGRARKQRELMSNRRPNKEMEMQRLIKHELDPKGVYVLLLLSMTPFAFVDCMRYD